MEGLDVLEERKTVDSAGIRTPDRPANSLMTMPACRLFNFKISALYVSKNGDLLAIYRREVGNSGTTSCYKQGRQKWASEMWQKLCD